MGHILHSSTQNQLEGTWKIRATGRFPCLRCLRKRTAYSLYQFVTLPFSLMEPLPQTFLFVKLLNCQITNMSSLAPFMRFSSEETKVSSSFEVFKLVQPTFKTHKCIPPNGELIGEINRHSNNIILTKKNCHHNLFSLINQNTKVLIFCT